MKHRPRSLLFAAASAAVLFVATVLLIRGVTSDPARDAPVGAPPSRVVSVVVGSAQETSATEAPSDATRRSTGPDLESPVRKAAAGMRVFGRVRRAEEDVGVALSLALVEVPTGGRYDRTESAVDGAFEFADVREGTWKLVVNDPTLVAVEPPPEIVMTKNAPRVEVELLVTEGGVIRGHVLCEEDDVGIAKVELSLAMPESNALAFRPFTRTDSDGHYEFQGLLAGVYDVIRERIPGHTSGDAKPSIRVEVEPGGETAGVDFSVRRGLGIRGLLRTEDGEPGVGVFLSFNSPDGTRRTGVETDDDGAFGVMGFEPGNVVHIGIEPGDGWARSDHPPLTLAEESIEDLELVLEPECVVEGVVVDSGGEPIPGMTVSFATEQGRLVAHCSTFDSGGRSTFVCGRLMSGKYALHASTPRAFSRLKINESGALETEAVQRIEGTVTVELEEGEHLRDVIIVCEPVE